MAVPKEDIKPSFKSKDSIPYWMDNLDQIKGLKALDRRRLFANIDTYSAEVVGNTEKQTKLEALREEISKDKIRQEENLKAKAKAQENWKKAKTTIMGAIHSENSSPIDTVRVRIKDSDQYLQELGQNKQIHGEVEVPILKMEDWELEFRQLLYKNGRLERTYDNEVADTQGSASKGMEGAEAFVMAKDGNLYIGEHSGGVSVDGDPLLVHGSFLSDRPAEMAGTLTIVDGKITAITNISGHYGPDELDMYRGIAKLKETMPNAFSDSCAIEIRGREPENINSFMTRLETPNKHNIKLHEELRQDRANEYSDYKKKLVEQNNVDALEKRDIARLRTSIEKDQGASLTPQFNLAVALKKNEELNLMIDAGINVNQEIGKGGLKPLHIASTPEQVEILLKAGADPYAKTEGGARTAAELKPELINDKVITTIFKNAISANDTKSIDNLLKHCHEHANKPLDKETGETLLSYMHKRMLPQKWFNILQKKGLKLKRKRKRKKKLTPCQILKSLKEILLFLFLLFQHQ